MKFNTLFKVSTGMLVLGLTFSAHAKTSSDDFNSMIEENNATQKELTTRLTKQLKTDKIKKRERPDFLQVGEEVLGKGGSENVVATTTPPKRKDMQRKSVHNTTEKESFNRLSQELKEEKE